MCTHHTGSYLQLKGLLPSSLIDRHYKIISDPKDIRRLKYQGLEHTVITHDHKKDMWTLDTADSKTSGISRASHASFTLGRHNWTITGDKGLNEGESYTIELKMSGCQKGEFTCNDGQCVSMEERCNQLPHCRDKSDEIDCKILDIDEGYNMRVPPVMFDEPVNVFVFLDILKIVDINEPDYSIEVQFEIMLKWTENRVKYNNLKKIDALNSLMEEDFQKLWLPEVVYENTDQKKSTRLGEVWEWRTDVLVKREEEHGTMSGLHIIDETEVFNGSRNSLIMNQTYTHTFQCNFQLSYYPFDVQVYIIKMLR